MRLFSCLNCIADVLEKCIIMYKSYKHASRLRLAITSERLTLSTSFFQHTISLWLLWCLVTRLCRRYEVRYPMRFNTATFLCENVHIASNSVHICRGSSRYRFILFINLYSTFTEIQLCKADAHSRSICAVNPKLAIRNC